MNFTQTQRPYASHLRQSTDPDLDEQYMQALADTYDDESTNATTLSIFTQTLKSLGDDYFIKYDKTTKAYKLYQDQLDKKSVNKPKEIQLINQPALTADEKAHKEKIRICLSYLEQRNLYSKCKVSEFHLEQNNDLKTDLARAHLYNRVVVPGVVEGSLGKPVVHNVWLAKEVPGGTSSEDHILKSINGKLFGATVPYQSFCETMIQDLKQAKGALKKYSAKERASIIQLYTEDLEHIKNIDKYYATYMPAIQNKHQSKTPLFPIKNERDEAVYSLLKQVRQSYEKSLEQSLSVPVSKEKLTTTSPKALFRRPGATELTASTDAIDVVRKKDSTPQNSWKARDEQRKKKN